MQLRTGRNGAVLVLRFAKATLIEGDPGAALVHVSNMRVLSNTRMVDTGHVRANGHGERASMLQMPLPTTGLLAPWYMSWP